MQTLADAQSSIERFLAEASTCAEEQCGFSCLLTVFPVMMGLAEAMRGPSKDAELLTWFVEEMGDIASWLISPTSVASTKSIGQIVVDIRHGLTHQCSLPPNVVLANSIEEAKLISASIPSKYIISTADLTQAVRETAMSIIEANPDREFDPTKTTRGKDRSTAHRIAWPALFGKYISGFYTPGTGSAIVKGSEEDFTDEA